MIIEMDLIQSMISIVIEDRVYDFSKSCFFRVDLDISTKLASPGDIPISYCQSHD